ncbi:hypothetical protein CFIO01_01067 [Colletotrichum fioriniae PJ7]|uniref:F-box domain-containing protein n=1 Tax=Colletotrichum fioriniae PJ7 TaxID=1445577 RepID=A0A010QXY8_9PEZI|nr:hypothetical protein CFIO01_01067 [Colletotrichum fioriniae PJ7]
MSHLIRSNRSYREIAARRKDNRPETNSFRKAQAESQNLSSALHTTANACKESLQASDSNAKVAQPIDGLKKDPAQPPVLSRFLRWIKALPSHPKKEKSDLRPGLDYALPLNLHLAIAKHLTMAERVALALSSKRMLAIMSNEQFWLNRGSSERLDLLKLLERDAINTRREILCLPCQIFHDPVLSVPPVDHDSSRAPTELDRPCVKAISDDQHQRLSSPYLPHDFHFNMVKAFLHSKRDRTGFFESILLEKSTICGYCYKREEANVQQGFECRVSSEGDLLMKTTTRLFACRDPNQTKDKVRFAVGLLKRAEFTTCCKHVDWVETYPFIFDYDGLLTDESKLHAYRASKGYGYDPAKKIRDIWDPAVKPRYGPKNHISITHCQSCYTNYEYEWKDTEDGSRIVFLISYKNLGKGMDTNDPKWSSHFDDHIPDAKAEPRRSHYDGFTRRPHYAWQEKADEAPWDPDY